MLGSLALTGCVSYEAHPLNADSEWNAFVARTLNNNELKTYLQQNLPPEAWPLPKWDLSRLTLAAFFFNPELDVVRAHWAVAEARTQVASEYPNPSLSVVPGYNTTTGTAAAISPWIVTTALDLPIETAHKRGYRIAAARSLSESARLSIAQTAWAVRRQVRAALLALYTLGLEEQNLRRVLDLTSEKATFLEHWLDAGEISAPAVDQARAEREASRVAWLNAGRHKALARARLAEAIGVPVQALDEIQLDFSAFADLPTLPSAEIRRQALLQRADVRAALADYAASQALLQQAIAEQYPDIQIGPGYEFDQSEDKWSIGLSVTLPVFNRNQGRIAETEAVRQEAAAAFRVVQARVIGQVDEAVTQYSLCLDKVKTSEAALRAQQARRDRMQKMLDVGESVRSDLIDAELALNASQSSRNQARIDALKALGQIEDAMQTAPDLPAGAENIPAERPEESGPSA